MGVATRKRIVFFTRVAPAGGATGFPIQARSKIVLAAVLLASLGAAFVAPRPTTAQQAAASGRGVISVEKSEQLFDVLSALYAAGYAPNSTWPGDSSDLEAYRARLRGLHGPAVEAIRSYYKDHLLSDPSQTLSRFASFALVVGPPPHFAYDLPRELLPPDVLSLEDLNEKLSAFYAEAKLGDEWARFQRGYDRQVMFLEGPVSKVVIRTNGYLREVVATTTARQFMVIFEPLIGSRTNFRVYGSRYTVIVASAQDPPINEIRHAYLHFLLDPLAYRYGNVVDTRRRLMDIAARAPRLPSEYVQDFPAFVTECMIKAVELRLEKLPLAKLYEQFDRNDADGFILVRPLYDGLQKFEQSEPAMTYYYPNLIESISVSGTQQRLQNFQFSPAVAQAAPPEHLAPQKSETDQWLEEGNDAIAARDVAVATAAFGRVLRKEPGNMSATYGLAVASLLKGDPESARQLLEKVTESAAKAGASGGLTTDPSTVAWSHVYLGRIHDIEGERDMAISEYQAAMAIAGIPDAAKLAAERGLQTAYQGPSHEAAPPKL